jgi:hypothetical protein
VPQAILLIMSTPSCGFIFFTEVRGAASNSAYGYPELWILRYLAQRYRYHAVPSPGFEPTNML